MSGPIHEHDCDVCIYIGSLGRTMGPGVARDVYVCPQGGYPTVIIRHGIEGDYISGEHLVLRDYEVWKPQWMPEDWRQKCRWWMRHWRKHYRRHERMVSNRSHRKEARRRLRNFNIDSLFGESSAR